VTTMRWAGTWMPKRLRYQSLMAWRSGSRPRALVYCVRPLAMLSCAAAWTWAGAV